MNNYFSNDELDWIEEKFGLDLPTGKRARETRWEHNDSGIDSIGEYSCGCRFVASYAHSSYGRDHFVSCDDPNCQGHRASICGSQGYVLCPSCAAEYSDARNKAKADAEVRAKGDGAES
jgi:hypothetical protein